MAPLIECVPNFSEGRDPQKIDAIVAAVRGVEGVYLLNVSSDPDHNRTVVTFAGAPEPVAEAAFRAIGRAGELIDLDHHEGAHPRLGATDVVPFIPVREATMADCVTLAEALGERVGRELGICVYLYAHAARRPERVRLPDVRRGEYELWKREIEHNPTRRPDFGPAEPHPWGATTIGARPFLIAYNLYLDTTDVSVARRVARAVRESSGGLPHVQARGFFVAGQAQVSMNLLDFRQTPVHVVQEAVRQEAAQLGAQIASAELVGLIPEDALLDSARRYLQLYELTDAQIFERRLAAAVPPDESAAGFVAATAAATPTPGGGAVAALVGALAAALAEMMAGFSRGQRFAEHAVAVSDALADCARLRDRLLAAVRADSAAFEGVMRAWRDRSLPAEAHAVALETATRRAGEVPLAVARDCREIVAVAGRIVAIGNTNVVTDGAGAALLGAAALRAAGLNVRVNAANLRDRTLAERWLAELDRLEAEAAAAAAEIVSLAALRGGYQRDGHKRE